MIRKDIAYMNNTLPLNYPSLDKWPDGYNYLSELDFSDVEGETIGLDIETTGLNPYDPKTEALSVSISGCEQSFCVHKDDFRHSLHLIRQIIESPECMVVGHNIKFDLNFLSVKFGWKARCLAYDTMLAAYFLSEEDRFISLEKLCNKYQIMAGYKSGVDRTNLQMMSKEDLLLYNMKDARACSILKKEIYDPTLRDCELNNIMSIACQAIPILSKMETRGVMVDLVYAKQQQLRLFDKMIQLKLSLKELSNTVFNPDSPKQLANVLYGVFNFTPYKFGKIQASTDYESIIRIRQEQCPDRNERDTGFIDTLIEYTKLGTLNEKYYNKLSSWIQNDGAVHTNYALGATTTGRLTSSSPNMQNQKRGSEFRGVYVPRQGYTFLEGDYSQIEIRIAAWLANEMKMIEMFERGLDIHTATLCEIKGWDYEETKELLDTPSAPDYQEVKNLRVGIKNINFGELYGASPHRLQREMVKNGIYWELSECQNLSEERKRLYPNIVKWKNAISKFIIHNKYVRMPFGQIRRLPLASWENDEGRKEIRQGVNFIIQSTASGWMPVIGMILLDKYFEENKIDGHILLNVHDSILSEIKILNEEKMNRIRQDVQQIMEKDIIIFIKEVFNIEINVPLEFKCDYLPRWR